MKKVLYIFFVYFFSLLSVFLIFSNKSKLQEHNLEVNTTHRYEDKDLGGSNTVYKNNIQDGYLICYQTNHITPNMPVIIFLEGGGDKPKISMYRGIMRLLADKGYFVIGLESGKSYDSNYAVEILNKAISFTKKSYQLTLSKVAVMGHSQGGGQAFYVMKNLQDKNYGKDGSLIISIDGWFAFNMDKSDISNLKGNISFIKMNNLIGVGADSRIHLSIWNLAKESYKTFFTLPQKDHFYIAGDRETMLKRTDILHIINSLCDDAFLGSDNGYNAIPDSRKTTYNQIYNALKPKDNYRGDCEGVKYNARKIMLRHNDIDYCIPELYQ